MSLPHDFAAVADQLAEFAAADPSYSAQVCSMHYGRTVIDMTVGPDLRPDSLIGVFSSSKGIAAMCVSMLLASGELRLDDPVARYWSDFAQGGKADITVRTALSHRAGVAGFSEGFTLDELAEHKPVAERLARMTPLWRPGTAHGYHGITIGIIIAELTERITGQPFAEFFRTRLRDPLGVDFHFGITDDDILARVVTVQPSEPASETDAELLPLWGTDPKSLPGLVFAAGDGNPPLPGQADHPAIRRHGQAAMGGIGNARALARLYSECLDHSRAAGLIDPKTIGAMTQIHSAGPDLVLGFNTRFGIVFQVADARLDYGSAWAFGHDGAGGSIGFADPASGLSFGYVTRRMPVPPGADQRGLALARTVRTCLRKLQ
jgi:CubicO group peptidase (beta-lactamase class C family)